MGPKNENKNLKDNDIQVPDESYKSETYHNYFLEKMCILWKENRLADVILQADKIR